MSISCLFSQEFNRDSCHIYYKGYQDAKLINHLNRSDNIREREKVHYYYYSALAGRIFGDHGELLHNLTAGFELCENGHDSMKWKFLDEFGILYRREGSQRSAKGMEYINESIRLKINNKVDSSELAKSYTIKGNLWFSDAQSHSNLDSAIHYFTLAQELNNVQSQKMLLLRNIATSNIRNGRAKSAKADLMQVMEYYKEKKLERQLVTTTINLAGYYSIVDSFSKADHILDTIQEFISLKPKWIKERNELVDMKIHILENDKRWEEVAVLRDSLMKIERSRYFTKLDEQVTKHSLENQLVREQAKTYRNQFWLSILLGTTGTLCLVLFGLFKYLGLRRKAVEKELEHTRTKAAYETTKAKMEGEQQERESIASILHDQVASLLTAADMHLKVAQKDEPELRGLKEAGSLIKDINEQVRDLSHQLVSPTLTKFGLEAGIDTLTDRMQTAEIEIEYSSNVGPARYENPIETFVFQSCAELIQNVLKHSTATICTVDISSNPDTLLLKVTDNGDNSEIDMTAPTGLGLTHIYNRAAAMEGEFKFCIHDKGSESNLTIPAIALPFQENF